MFRLFHIALLAAMIGLGAFGISRLSYNVEVLDLLPKGMPGVEGTALFQQLFDRPDRLIITLQGASEVAADEAATALAGALSKAPHLARTVHSQPAWETHPEDMLELVALAWLNAPPEKLQALEASLSQPQLAATLQRRIGRLSSSLDPLSVALDSNDLLGFTSAMRDAFDPAAMESMGGGGFANADGTFRVVYIDAPAPVGSYRDAAAWLGKIRALAEGIVPAEVRIGYTGTPAFQAEIGTGMEKDMNQSVTGITFIVGFLFWLLHRQIRPLFVILLAMLGTGLITLGLAGILFGSLNVMSMGFAAILMGMIEDFGVLGLNHAMQSPGQSFRDVHRRAYPAIWWSAVTSASVFAALGLSTLPGIAQMGVLTSLGILVGAGVMLYGFLPIAMRFGVARPHAPVITSGSGARWPGILAIAAGLGCLAVLATQGLPSVAAGTSVLRPKQCQAFDDLMIFDQEMKPEGDTVTWLPVVIKQRDETALAETLQQVDRVLAEALHHGQILGHYLPAAFAPHPARQQANLPRLAAIAGDRARLFAAADEAGVSEQGLGLATAVMDLWSRWAAEGIPPPRWPDLNKLEDVLGTQLQRNDGELLACGFLRLTKNESVFDAPVIEQLEALPGVHVSGWEYLSDQLKTVLPREVKRVLLPAGLVLAVFFFIVFRNGRERLLALGSLAFSGLILVAAMSLLGIEWNFVNVGAIPLCLGLGLDFNINMIYALRRSAATGESTDRVGRALAYCGLSTGLGFGALALADNMGLASFGLCSMIGVLATLFVAAFVVPWVAGRLTAT